MENTFYETNQNKNNIIVAENLIAKIIDIREAVTKPGLIIVNLQIVEDLYKGVILKDFIYYSSTNPASWKYYSLRKSSGVPFNKDITDISDTGKVLINKHIRISLSKYLNPHTGKEYQNIKYLPYLIYLDEYNYSKNEYSIFNESLIDLPGNEVF